MTFELDGEDLTTQVGGQRARVPRGGVGEWGGARARFAGKGRGTKAQHAWRRGKVAEGCQLAGTLAHGQQGYLVRPKCGSRVTPLTSCGQGRASPRPQPTAGAEHRRCPDARRPGAHTVTAPAPCPSRLAGEPADAGAH